jgi:hypothetical protein
VAVFQGNVYCLRDADASTATLWRSSGAGWVSVRAGLRAGGTLRTTVASFSGNGGDLALYGVDGRNRCWSYTGSVFTFAPNIYATEGTSSTSITPGAGSKVFTTESGRGWTTAHTVRIYSATDATKYMVGTVTSYSTTTLTVNVTSFAGGAATDWHICLDNGIDRASVVIAHKNHLFLAYPRGQLQHSALGAPFTFSGSSGVIGLGDEIVDLATLRSDVLAIFQSNRISMLYGSGTASWELKQHSRSSNTRAVSAQEIGGNAVFLNDAGVMSLTGSDSFGDFDAANIAGDALRSLRQVMTGYTTTSLVKTDSQYRIYGDTRQVLVMAWQGSSPSPQSTAYTRLRYLHQPVCATSDNIGGEEYVIFGTDDGWVMRERVGTTFDGEPISAFLRTSYWHSKSPAQKKRYRKLTIDCDAEEEVAISFKLDYDFAGLEYSSSINFTAVPSGGYYDTDNWDEFFWSNPDAAQLETNIEGVARFMSIVLWTDGSTRPFSVYGMSLQYSPLEIKR